MSDFRSCPPVRRLPVASLQFDPTGPRGALPAIAATDSLLGSIKTLGILTPLVVVQTRRHHYTIVEGARRYQGALKLGLTTVPCQVHARLSPRRLAALRLAFHTTIAPWTKNDTHRATEAVKATQPGAGGTLSKTALAILGRLPAAYREEFQRCRPKLRSLGSLSVEHVILNLLGRVPRHVITNARAFRALGQVFATREHDRQLLGYLKHSRMTVDELLGQIRKPGPTAPRS